MAKTFKLRVGNLVAELFAHANVIFRFLKPARAVTVLSFKPIADSVNDFFIGIKNYFHKALSP